MRVLRFLLILVSIPFSAMAHPPTSVVADSRGNVFFSDLDRVWMVTPDGKKAAVVSGVHSHELAVDASDHLHGEHLWYEGDDTGEWGHYLWQRSPEGRVVRGNPARGFRQDHSFVRDRSGTMYWATAGEGIRKLLAPGEVTVHAKYAFRDPRAMTATPDGTLFVIDQGDLLRFDAAGRGVTLARSLAEHKLTQFTVNHRHDLMGLWTDDRENVYVAVYGARKVKRVTPSGVVSVVYESTFPWSPTGGLTTSDGSLWILEASVTNAIRLRRVDANGKTTTY